MTTPTDTMQIPQAQIEQKKKVGKVNGRDVYHFKTRGGLHLMTMGDRGRVIGSGSHRAVARVTAQKTEPNVVWSELSKSDHYALEELEHLIPKYTELTLELRKMQDEAGWTE